MHKELPKPELKEVIDILNTACGNEKFYGVIKVEFYKGYIVKVLSNRTYEPGEGLKNGMSHD